VNNPEVKNREPATRSTMTSLRLLGKIIAAVVVLAAALKFLLFGGTISYESPIGKIEFQSNKSSADTQFAGEEGKPRDGTGKTVWQSECPSKSKPISGTCVVKPGQATVPALQNIGPNINDGANRWECAWQGPVENADVRAVCVRTEN
jgi:hypothetical protein